MSETTKTVVYLCRMDGRCQYAIDHGAEGMGHCPKGKCVMSSPSLKYDMNTGRMIEVTMEEL